MAEYYASHDFLVREGSNPEMEQRETVASILVNQGTTPNVVVVEALNWIKNNRGEVSFDITWYTPGHLVPTTLRNFRDKYPHLLLATQLFLFPGRVDHQTESVSGPDAEVFAENLLRRFTYAILSANSFDINTGTVYFHLPEEVRLQKACATRYAAHKFLFLDSSKFRSEGEIGYSIVDLLDQSEAVTVYTVSSDKNEWIRAKFEALSDRILDARLEVDPRARVSSVEGRDMKSFRLRILGTRGKQTDALERKGFLRKESDKDAGPEKSAAAPSPARA